MRNKQVKQETAELLAKVTACLDRLDTKSAALRRTLEQQDSSAQAMTLRAMMLITEAEDRLARALEGLRKPAPPILSLFSSQDS